jgi:putative spermidine/putrescine transport system ATP-binding protein
MGARRTFHYRNIDLPEYEMTTPSEKSTALPIHISGLTKRYGELYALDSVDLDIRSGEFLTLLGPSGSGKTTLLMAIAGFNRPDSGSIRFGDREMITTPPHRREVGMVFQSYALFPHMSVAENIGFPLKLRNVGVDERAERVEAALATVQLSGFGDRGVDQLSGGQRQRVALARAFVFRPQILLMDEPLSALDKKLREQMQIELKHLHQQLGVTTVYVTHDQREALTMSDRIAVINHGRLAQVDSPQTIYNHPADSFVADFIGESSTLPLTRGSSGELLFQDQVVTGGSEAGNGTAGGSLVIRPERLFLVGEQGVDPAQTIQFEGEVHECVFQGETAFVLVRVAGDHELSMRFSTSASESGYMMQPGERVTVGVARSDAIIIPPPA